MNTIGISAGYHDAGLAVVSPNGEILFAGHSERYSRIKNDSTLNNGIINEVDWSNVKQIAYYERPWMHNIQQLRSGEYNFQPWTPRGVLKKHLAPYLPNQKLPKVPLHSFPHHLSHAALAFQTSPFQDAIAVVVDAIGELDTITIWKCDYNILGEAIYRPLWRQRYPHSIGLFYSAMTKRVGLKPNEDEYILSCTDETIIETIEKLAKMKAKK